MPVLYGIRNCDTVKKARNWLEARDVDYVFHDLRADGLAPAVLQRWARALGWEALLNRRSRTWRELPDTARRDMDQKTALQLMHAHPTLIRRPVLEAGEQVLAGFDAAQYQRLLKQSTG